MIGRYLAQLCDELQLGAPPLFEKDGVAQLQISSFSVAIVKQDPAIYLVSNIAPLPIHGKEEFLLRVMKANFLGQGTGGCVLGLKEDESDLTLSLCLSLEVDYPSFKLAIENFINYVEFWKNETARDAAKAEVK